MADINEIDKEIYNRLILLVERVAREYGEYVYSLPEVFENWASVRINRYLLGLAVTNAVVDIRRMSELHLPGSVPDRHKYAGFVSKWIAKEKPIYFDARKFMEGDKPVECPISLLTVNSGLAIEVLAALIKTNIPEDLYDSLRYSFQYRDEKGETLAILAYCCEQMQKNSQ